MRMPCCYQGQDGNMSTSAVIPSACAEDATLCDALMG